MTLIQQASSVTSATEATLARLAVLDGPALDRARTRIIEVLSRVNASAWPDVAWRASRLTNTGAPLEFAWASRDCAIRWTAEVAPVETPDRERLGIAAGLAFPDGACPVERLDRVSQLQVGQQLRFGAWLGMRHRAEGDEAKVYAELPPVPLVRAATALGVGPHSALRTVGLTSRMVGLFADGGVELYARSGDLDELALAGLEASLFGSAGALWPAVVDLVGSPRLPRPCGVSVVIGPDGTPDALTWFTFAKALFGSDEATVAALAGRTSSAGSIQVLHALAGGTPDGRWRCGMVGVGVAERGQAWFQVGMRPS